MNTLNGDFAVQYLSTALVRFYVQYLEPYILGTDKRTWNITYRGGKKIGSFSPFLSLLMQESHPI